MFIDNLYCYWQYAE